MSEPMQSRLDEIHEHFGEDEQWSKLREECSELVEAIDEYLLYHCPSNLRHVYEEVADVLSLMCQKKVIHAEKGLSIGIRGLMADKIERTEERIKSGYYKEVSNG